jgi:ABC-type antimicrobial peptide transport system permease subunit
LSYRPLVLTTAAALYVSTVRNLTRGDGGYRTRNILLVRLDAVDRTVDGDVLRAGYDAVLRGAQALPGAESVALTFDAPVLQDAGMWTSIETPGSIDARKWTTRLNLVSTRFLSTAGIGLTAGRDFASSDDASAPAVAIVSEAFERRHYAQRSALGQTVLLGRGPTAKSVLIVGVAQNAGYDKMAGTSTNLRTLESEILYQPLSQAASAPTGMTLIVRTAGDPLDLAPAVRRFVEQGRLLRAGRVAGLGQLLDDDSSRERFAAALATGFGIIALILTSMGVFGILWFYVSRRTREIGIRMAMGARPADAMLLVLRQSMTMTVIGLALGLPLAIGAAWTVRAQFYGVGPADPLVLLGSSMLLAAIAVVASVVPIRYATRVDPLVALREEG